MKLKSLTQSLIFLLFTTSASYAQYCSPTITAPPVSTWGIGGVQYSNLVKSSTIDTYSDFLSDTALIELGATNTLVISYEGSPQLQKVVWIDWDLNESFDSTEMYIFTSFSNFIDITTPSYATEGATRMRVAIYAFGATNIDACTSSLFEVEDYTINVVNDSNVGLTEEYPAIVPFELFPNPAKSVVNIKWYNSNIESDVVIYNNMGQVVGFLTKAELKNPIDISTFTSGLYFIKAEAIENVLPVKLIIQ